MCGMSMTIVERWDRNALRTRSRQHCIERYVPARPGDRGRPKNVRLISWKLQSDYYFLALHRTPILAIPPVSRRTPTAAPTSPQPPDQAAAHGTGAGGTGDAAEKMCFIFPICHRRWVPCCCRGWRDSGPYGHRMACRLWRPSFLLFLVVKDRKEEGALWADERQRKCAGRMRMPQVRWIPKRRLLFIVRAGIPR